MLTGPICWATEEVWNANHITSSCFISFSFFSLFPPLLFGRIHIQEKRGTKRLQTFSKHSVFKLSSYCISSQKEWHWMDFRFHFQSFSKQTCANQKMILINPVGTFLFFTQISVKIHSQKWDDTFTKKAWDSIPLAHNMLYCFHNVIKRSIYTTVAPKGALLDWR